MTYKEFMDYLLKRKKPNDTVFDPNTPIENALYETEVEQYTDVVTMQADDYDDEINNYWNEMLTEQATHNNITANISSNLDINLIDENNYKYNNTKYLDKIPAITKFKNINATVYHICNIFDDGKYELINNIEIDLKQFNKIRNEFKFTVLPKSQMIYQTGTAKDVYSFTKPTRYTSSDEGIIYYKEGVFRIKGRLWRLNEGWYNYDIPIENVQDYKTIFQKDILTITISFNAYEIDYDIYNPNFTYNNSWETYSRLKASNTINGDDNSSLSDNKADSARVGDIPEWSRFPAKYKELDYEYTTEKITNIVKRITRKVKAKMPIIYDYSMGNLNLEGFRLYHLINFLIKLYPDREPEEATKCLFKYVNTDNYTLKIDEHTFGEENLNGLVKTFKGSTIGWNGKIERKVPKYYKTEDKTFITRDYAEYLERQIRKLEVKNGIS
jgi:hypothetical protein